MTPRRSRRKASAGTRRTTEDTGREVCSAIQHIYNDVSSDAVTAGAMRLWQIYIKDRDSVVGKNEYIAELAHRTRLFIEGAKDLNMQLQVLHTVAVFVNKCVKESDDEDMLQEMVAVVNEKRKHNSNTVRGTTVLFTGQLLQYSLKSMDDLENNEFPSTFDEESFTQLYMVLAQFADIDDEVTRRIVVKALQPLQEYPQLMKDVEDPTMHAKYLVTQGMFDPSEVVRSESVKALEPFNKEDGRFMIEVLLRDPSSAVRRLAASEISVRVPLGLFDMVDVRTVFNDKGLFLGDNIVSEYYDLLLAWSQDTYCSFRDANPDEDISPEHLFEGIYYFFKLMHYTKDMHPIALRMYHRMRTSEKLDVIKFVRAYIDAAPYSVHTLNFKSILDSLTGEEETLFKSLNSKLRRVLMWHAMVEYTCSYAVPEPIRIEARLLLLPTMSEYAKVFTDVWTKLGELSQLPQGRIPNVAGIFNTIVLFLIKNYEYLESEELGKSDWLNTITTVLTDTTFHASAEVVAALVKNWLIHHLNALTDADHAINTLADFIHDFNKSDSQLNSTQEMFPLGNDLMDDTQMSQAPPPQQSVSDTDPVTFARIVRILTAVLASGVFKKGHPVLEGLVKSFFLNTNDHNADQEVHEDICVALAAGFPLFGTNDCLFVPRLAFRDPVHRHVWHIALPMVSDSIMVRGLKEANQMYFSIDGGTEEGAFDLKGNLENLFLHFLDDPAERLKNLAYRCLLQFIMFDYVDDFKESFTELLLRAFMPNVPERIVIMLRQFWITFCSVSREHQCRLVVAYVRGIKRLATCDLSSSIAKVDKDELTEFVIDVTSYGCLKPNAIDREFGSAHVFLAKELLTLVLVGGDDMIVSEVIMSALSHCEVSEIAEHSLLQTMWRGSHKAMFECETPNFKEIFDILAKRYETVFTYVKKNGIPSPVFPTRTTAQLEQELRSYLSRVTSHNERKYAQPWLETTDVGLPQVTTERTTVVEDGDLVHVESTSAHGTPQPASASSSSTSCKKNPTKMKMWHERNVNFEQLMVKHSQLKKAVVTHPPPPTITRPRRAVSRNNSLTPASPAHAVSSTSSLNSRSQQSTPVSRRRLVPITEQVEVDTIMEE